MNHVVFINSPAMGDHTELVTRGGDHVTDFAMSKLDSRAVSDQLRGPYYTISDSHGVFKSGSPDLADIETSRASLIEDLEYRVELCLCGLHSMLRHVIGHKQRYSLIKAKRLTVEFYKAEIKHYRNFVIEDSAS